MYGIFNSEGCLENGFTDADSAETRAYAEYLGEDELRVELLCDDHEEQPAETCEECFG